MSRLIKILCLLLIAVTNHFDGLSQATNDKVFTQRYEQAGKLINQTCDSLKKVVNVMITDSNLTDIEKAKINLIRSKFHVLDDMQKVLSSAELVPFDTMRFSGSYLTEAQKLIIQSRPDEGIPLIMKYLEDAESQSDSAIFASIYLAEAYRQKQEYDKGIDMMYSILTNHGISKANRAFALNRMAALQNEKQPFEGDKADSVSKYSRLCLDISKKNNLTEYLAASQNELGSNFYQHGNFDSAMYYFTEATNNFLQINKFPQAINTHINLSRVYSGMGMEKKSKEILLKALELGDVEKNRNLFMYVYDNLANISFLLGDYKDAYEYSKISHHLLTLFYNDRIQRQINEMSAKYDLKEKEIKIREEEQKNKTYHLQKNYLILIAMISTLLLMILIVLFRFKSKAYNQLVAQNLKAMKLEKQVEQCLINLSESDIRRQAGPEGQNKELALRLEKFLAEEKPFLWSEVSLEEFCKKLNTNRTYLSKLIHERYQMGFYDLLFEYRVRAALDHLTNPHFNHLSVEGIGEMAGFKSNSNFHKKFKTIVGMTPNQFRERVQKTSVNQTDQIL